MIGRRAWAAVLLVVVTGCGSPGPEPAPAGAPETSAAPASPPTEQPDGGGRVAVPVYYVAETAAGPRLQREFRSVVTSDPASAAVREMLARPTGTDPDYRNHWPGGTRLREPVHRDGEAIVVDLTGTGPAQVGRHLGELMEQQLVYTVQGALQSTDPVRILVDGVPEPHLWGTVGASALIQRGDPYALRSLVQIDSPADGERVGREVVVRGEAAVFEATVLWEVLREGSLVEKGFTSTAEGQRFAPFAFTVVLEPGEYTVRILESDPSDGEGRPALSDDKRITVA